MRHSFIRPHRFVASCLGITCLAAVAASAGAEPPLRPVQTRTLQAPVITTAPFDYGKYVTYSNADTYAMEPNLPKKPMELPKEYASGRKLLELAVADTGYTLEIDAAAEKSLEKTPKLYIASMDQTTSADIIDIAVRLLTQPRELDYDVQGKTIRVFPAAKDADGFRLRHVSVNAKDAPLADVLKDVLGNTGYRLFLPMRLQTKITVQCQDVTIGEAIRAILAAAPGNLESVRMTSGGSGQTLFIQEKGAASPRE
jgi:hypothetical protein